MLPTLVFGLGLALIAEVPATAPSAASTPELASYEAAQKKAGRGPAAHIQRALWCEAHGLEAERMKHLVPAVLIEPRNATARGLMGQASYRGS